MKRYMICVATVFAASAGMLLCTTAVPRGMAEEGPDPRHLPCDFSGDRH
jgi:hypothetical protein